LLWAAARYSVDDILTRDVQGFSEAVQRRVAELAEARNLGITVEQCPVTSVAPRQVKEAFNNVVKADQARGKLLNEARTSEIQILSRASADATSRTNLAESDRVRLVNEVSSRAEQFQDLLPKYRANPGLFEQQRRLETFGRLLTNVQDKIFIPVSAEGGGKELRLLLNREPPKPKGEEQKP
jgi:membrane protease subunit HflK